MKTVRVVAAVIKENNRIFATARGYGDCKGMWEFPGGKIEPGETPQDALHREIREELTAEITVGELIRTIEYDYPTFHLSMDCFWCTVRSGELTLLEADDGKWLTKDELYSVKWLPADFELIEQIKAELDNKYENLEDKTLDYYNKNAKAFFDETQSVDLHDTQDLFLSYLSQGSSILDFGCGSGRDSKYFLEKGYHVVATDGSEELCNVASAYVGILVHKLLFQELQDEDQYDGIWACSSILHAKKEDLPNIFKRMIIALKEQGYIYVSFKYGEFEGIRGERYYTDFNEKSFTEFISEFSELKIEKMWVSADVRSERSNEKWLNVILHKSIIN